MGGAGIVALQSILPIYFKENLKLSNVQLTLAFSFCKGISFVITSPLWASYVNRNSLYLINSLMNFFTCLFIFFIFAANYYLEWLFVAYLMYGTMQAGCELSWNMSGPVFSLDKNSTFYSSVNLVLVGIRGCICPFIGQLIFFYSGATGVFLMSFILCLLAMTYAFWTDYIYKKQTQYHAVVNQ